MLWIVSCLDKPNTAAIRDSVLQPHRDYLGSQKKILVLAGATQNDEGTADHRQRGTPQRPADPGNGPAAPGAYPGE